MTPLTGEGVAEIMEAEIHNPLPVGMPAESHCQSGHRGIHPGYKR